jgi:hypothetical protein
MDIHQLLDQLKSLNTTVIAALIAAVVAFIVGVFNLVIGILSYKNQKKGVKIQKDTYDLQSTTQKNGLITQEIDKLQKEIEEFYIPFHSYLSQSFWLYSNLRQNLPSEFRALIYLIDNDYLFKDKDGSSKKVTFGQSQNEILKEIFVIEDKLRDLIVRKEGIITDKSLIMTYTPNNAVTDVFSNFDPNRPQDLPKDIGLLDLFIVHCTLLKLANNNLLDKVNIDAYKNFVYPRELNKKIKDNIISLNSKISTLRQQIQDIK